ncbi:response regulator receiver domain protein [Enterococcus faecalis 13-SD-W-01]|nr:response regulator receiver domain protein [Enterococcus faecalis 13-SD-W-01]
MYSVLLVDDEYMILNGLKKIVDWQALGFEVTAVAESALAGLAAMEKNSIDLVITDVTMPEINGLEFIEAAQKEQQYFEFIILSGYQKFDYLKSGLQLGAVNYLMKPVNKIELIDSLTKVKHRLDQRKKQKNQQEIYQEVLFSQWLNEELDEESEEELMRSICTNQSYRILLAQIPREEEQPILNWLKDNKEKFYYQRNYGEQQVFTILLSKRQAECFCRDFTEVAHKENWLISVGEETEDIDQLPETYQRAKDNLKLHQFYGERQCRIFYSTIERLDDQTIDFLAFSRALQKKQIDYAEKMIHEFFDQFHSFAFAPEDVRHFTFLLLMDVQRELANLEDEEYLKGIQCINQAETVHELQELILSLLKRQQAQKAYSKNVKNVLDILHEQYQEALTLKNVAETLHLNVMYLGQLFKKETKKSFSAYLNHFRIEQAKWLLLHSEKNVNEIANEVGYTNTTYFSRLFKKLTGQTPKDFRDSF